MNLLFQIPLVLYLKKISSPKIVTFKTGEKVPTRAAYTLTFVENERLLIKEKVIPIRQN